MGFLDKIEVCRIYKASLFQCYHAPRVNDNDELIAWFWIECKNGVKFLAETTQ